VKDDDERISILRGAEVNILKDGSLDLENNVLSGLLTPVLVNIVTHAFPKSGKDHYARSVFCLVIIMYLLVDVV
jgi:histidinol phosphatase-like PHP family hydrolase